MIWARPRRHRCVWCLAVVGQGGTPPSMISLAGGCPGATGASGFEADPKHIPRVWPPLVSSGVCSRTESETANALTAAAAPTHIPTASAPSPRCLPTRVTQKRYTRSSHKAAVRAARHHRHDSSATERMQVSGHLLGPALAFATSAGGEVVAGLWMPSVPGAIVAAWCVHRRYDCPTPFMPARCAGECHFSPDRHAEAAPPPGRCAAGWATSRTTNLDRFG